MKRTKLPLQMILAAFHLRIKSLHSFLIPSQSPLLIRSQTFSNYDRIKFASYEQPFTSTSSDSLPISIPTSSSSSSLQSLMPTNTDGHRRRRIGIIGGGASGMFAATAAADAVRHLHLLPKQPKQGEQSLMQDCDVIVFEGTSKTMSKVRISGGGRCNVMHDKTKPLQKILASYPRGNKELRGLYTKRFTPDDAYEWFTSRGVQLKTESDGRMFPITDNSQTIIDAISHAAIQAGVEVRMKEKVESVECESINHDNNETRFLVNTSSKLPNSSGMVKRQEQFDALILATGSFPIGKEIAHSLGHTIVKPVPSLFTLDAKDFVKDGGIFHGLAGVSVPMARLTLVVIDEMTSSPAGKLSDPKPAEEESNNKSNATKTRRKRKKKAPSIVQEGPLLITHHGVSGPAALRLSAFAAREFHSAGYQCDVKIHFCPKWEEDQRISKDGGSEGALMDALWSMSRLIPKRRVATGCPLFMKGRDASGEDEPFGDTPKSAPVIPKRLWSALVQHSAIPLTTTWGDASKAMIRSLANNLSAFPLRVTSKGIFKEEFVTAGGVHLKEMKMSNMESKVIPGLFVCGEVLDVDGVTGGFNFMGCWSTGFVAGEGAAEYCFKE
eukprot:CAMPEP_0172526942 /NCGR_PEP_ID=MMETSP1067-20121228/1753_1 /TAXON_ID=265564 ORGANISM="Thalassiosira punctigera, Strain Tpunct2005C2" /NCGR_SAMPLE_ID=MMETSP1067 /ASSEMBLY_ACC=CAM_ASM_000444 /LENGTH=609 /DNA_ID=CAMNT_0013310581 /DNA_START=53 /DNA_END=1882 /DNA_ORIENTATION=-